MVTDISSFLFYSKDNVAPREENRQVCRNQGGRHEKDKKVLFGILWPGYMEWTILSLLACYKIAKQQNRKNAEWQFSIAALVNSYLLDYHLKGAIFDRVTSQSC